MKPVVMIAAACLLLALLQPVVSIKCYTCVSTSESNCKGEETSCPKAYDRCFKTVAKDNKGVGKGCTDEKTCEKLKKACDTTGCGYFGCCKGELCNAGSGLKSMSVLIALAMMIAFAGHF
ncbi:sperm acrosome membrane-associated protein 4 [Exaiptasia diaphana]|uniref:Snake toxin/toxin-like domain-containing protein n=1 Tax=Exaiptasia diaphana TaxID=2652724 RepID=A0A913Y1R8_EXADI|nr:sperm acrosome membrane-associated protein 4 [Exaiptasia diaphana]KXJ07270.1 hypothetical protein AC249_AIPGENE19263 [Exaiptasia diaphana]